MQKPRKDTATTMGTYFTFAAWILVLVFMSLLFSKVLQFNENPNGVVQGHITDGIREVTLQRSRNGHYVADGLINGKKVTFMLDTGASDVSVPAGLAQKLGLRKGAPANYQTANGTITSYMTRIKRIDLGVIVLRNIRASINPAVPYEDTVLLGMSFLKNIEFTQKGDQLILRQ